MLSTAFAVPAAGDVDVGAAADGGDAVPMEGHSRVSSLVFDNPKDEANAPMLVCCSRRSCA